MDTLLDELFRRHCQELLAFVARQGNVNSAEDITQESFLRLMQHPNLAAIENHRAYLFKTAANLSKNAYDHEQVRLRYAPDESVDLEQVVCSLPALELTVALQQRVERFLLILTQLPEVVQHAFILSKLDGLSYPELAEALGISNKTAQRYVFKAWQHLIRHLEDDC
jgi:RNA polymerase sigma-70 factor (ECF subfamily)